ncbi:MAG: amidohydrolase [Chloroflexi bacterium]|nr:amidohydrolase [Chloroflexota bacterium]
MERNELKKRVCEAIDARRDTIVSIGEDIRLHPELGYKEVRTAAIVSEHLGRLGVPHETGLAITGVKGVLDGCSPGPTIAYMGELDSIVVPEHPDADPVTGAAHACGHNAQIANLLGVAYGLVEGAVMPDLAGRVALMAVPAEEYVEVGYRLALKEQGIIEFLGGKPELVRLGAFDDVDMAMLTHQASRETGKLSVGGPTNGCVVKLITYIGRASHAGGAPHRGVNALKAATLALQAIDMLRETFQDDDHIRVHPIITHGGDLVNVIPADVRLETYVRGASVDAIVEAASKVDRCLRAGAMALGATVRIRTLPGYLPRKPATALAKLYRANAIDLVRADGWWDSAFGAGSTDMGDISHIMPAIEAQAAGFSGTGHGADYLPSDPEVAYIIPAKAAAMTLVDLLAEGAGSAREMLVASTPEMTRGEYLAFMRSLDADETWKAE